MQKTSPHSATETTAPGKLHWWLLFATLAALLFSLNLNSVGVTRGGDNDEGSGIGGTGRQALPGSESGLGGTGLRPFVSMNTQHEVEAAQRPRHDIRPVIDPQAPDIPPVQPVTSVPIEAPVTVALDARRTRDSGAIDIAEQIQRDIDSNALTFQRLRTGEGSSRQWEPTVFAATTPDTINNGATRSDEGTRSDEATRSAIAPPTDFAASASELAADTDTATSIAEATEEDTVSWDELAGFLAETAASEANEREAATSKANARRTRPEHLQRPELPPLQRVRPIQRAAVLPPRIKPLAL